MRWRTNKSHDEVMLGCRSQKCVSVKTGKGNESVFTVYKVKSGFTGQDLIRRPDLKLLDSCLGGSFRNRRGR